MPIGEDVYGRLFNVIGDAIDVKGPVGHMHYLGRGRYILEGKERFTSRINLIAGGTGITLCYQILKAVAKDAEDTTEVSLLYANQSPEDVLLREELDALAQAHDNISVWYTVDRVADDGWPFSVGHINGDMIKERLRKLVDITPGSKIVFHTRIYQCIYLLTHL